MNATPILIAVLSLALLLTGCGASTQTDSKPRGGSERPNTENDTPREIPTPEVQAQVAKLDGKWVGVSFHIDGLPGPVSKWYRYSFSGDKMTTETADGAPASVKYYLNPHTSPKQLDTSIMVEGVEEFSQGIYSLDGDELKLSWSVAGERPTDFQSRHGDEKIVLVLRRAAD